MIYPAPLKYYNEDGQFKFWLLAEDFARGELSSEELRRIENNIRLLRPLEYKELCRYLGKVSFA